MSLLRLQRMLMPFQIFVPTWSLDMDQAVALGHTAETWLIKVERH